MIIADIDDSKKARRVLVVISLSWLALNSFDVDLSGINFAGIEFDVSRKQAEFTLLLSGLYTLFVFLFYSFHYFVRLNQQMTVMRLNAGKDMNTLPDSIDLTSSLTLGMGSKEWEDETNRKIHQFSEQKHQEMLDGHDRFFQKFDITLEFSAFIAINVLPPILLFGYCLVSYFN